MRAIKGKYIAIISIYVFIICISSASATKVILDEKGVPFVDYGFVSPVGDSSDTEQDGWVYIGNQRNPLTVSTQGAAYYHQYLQGNDSARDLFLNCADWLIENAEIKDGIFVWEYKYPWPTYNNTPSFISCMSQASAIKVLAMAYDLTGEEKYIEAAKKGLDVFFIEVENGGITYKEGDGWWYEEYAQEGMDIEPRVLNGHISALLDLQEYYNLTKDETAKELFDLGVSGLKAHLADYDAGNWSYYDAVGNKAVLKYHELHVGQLDSIFKITADPYFKLYRNTWAYYELTMLQENLAKAELAISKIRMYQSEQDQKIVAFEAMISEGG
jgi:heparosan-N-sulfate-glucuronate 5-epimerase